MTYTLKMSLAEITLPSSSGMEGNYTLCRHAPDTTGL